MVNSSPDDPDLRSRVVEWVLVLFLAANLVWTTLCLGGYRPETMVVTSLLNALLLAVHLVGRAWCGRERRFHVAGWCLLPFLVYAGINAQWMTPVRWLGWHDWLWWAQMLLVFWVVLNGVRRAGPKGVLFGVLAIWGMTQVVLAAYQRYVDPSWLMMGREQADQFMGRSSGSFGIPNSMAAVMILLLPAVWVLAGQRKASAVQRVLFGYVGVSLLLGLILTVSRGGWLALAGALLVWPLLMNRLKWRWRLGGMAAVMGALVLVGWGLWQFNPSARERFQQMAVESGEWTRPVMWQGAWKLFQEHPWVGSGAGSYNVLFEKYRPPHYQHEPQWTHNDYLNTLSDYGVVGFLLFFGVVALVMLNCRRQGRGELHVKVARWDTPLFWQAIGIGLLAFAVQLMVDFHFKIPALAMMVAMMGGLWVQSHWPRKSSVKLGGAARGFLVLIAGVGMWSWVSLVGPHYRAEAQRYAARQSLDKLWQLEESDPEYGERLGEAWADLKNAVEIDRGNAQAWSDLAYATALRSREDSSRAKELGQEAEGYAGRALGLTDKVPEFWVRSAVAKDMQGRWLEAGRDLSSALLLAPASAPVWYHQAYHLSLRTSGIPLARAAADYCLRLDPGYVAAQRLRQQLASGN